MRPSLASMALAGAVLAAVVVVDPAGLAPFGPARWTLAPALVLGAAAATTGRWSMAQVPTMAWGVFLAVVAGAAAVGLDPLYGWLGTPERRFGAATWLLCALAFAVAQAVPERRVVAGAAVIAAGVVGAWTVAELLGWEPVRLVGVGDRPVATFGSSAYLGAAAVLLGPVALGWRTRWATAAAALAGVALVASGARAAWVGALVAAGVLVLVRRRSAALVGAGVVVAVALAALTGVAGRVVGAVTDGDGGVGGRLDEWRIATRVVVDHPLTGVGPEGYRIAFGGAVDDVYEIEHGRAQLPDRAHSAPLDVLVTTGAFGLLAYLALLVIVGRYVVRALRGDDALDRGLALGLIGYGAQSLFLFPVAELEPVAWTMAGLLVSREGTRVRVRVPRVAFAAVAVVALGAGALDVVADHRAKAILAGDAVDPHGAAALRPDALRYHLVEARVSDIDRALVALDRALDVSPLDPVVRSERARLLLERARRTDVPADLQQARDALEALAVDDPRNAEVLLRLGVVRALDGDVAGAEEAWLLAERLAPGSTAATTNLENLRSDGT